MKKGKNVLLGKVNTTEKNGGKIIIDDGTYINSGTFRADGANITIGKYCRISYDVVMLTNFTSHLIDKGVDRRQPVFIKDNVWIGWRAMIKGGVTVGDFAIVGMGAVVVHDIPPFHVGLGNPAKDMGLRSDFNEIESYLRSIDSTGGSFEKLFKRIKKKYDIIEASSSPRKQGDLYVVKKGKNQTGRKKLHKK